MEWKRRKRLKINPRHATIMAPHKIEYDLYRRRRLPFGKNAGLFLYVNDRDRFCVVTNGAARFSVCSSIWDYTLFILEGLYMLIVGLVLIAGAVICLLGDGFGLSVFLRIPLGILMGFLGIKSAWRGLFNKIESLPDGKRCPNCGSDVNPKAKVCPYCHYKFKLF